MGVLPSATGMCGDPARPIVLVVGCPRSGTYLLSLMLDSEFGYALPVETHFIPLFVPYLHWFGALDSPRNRGRLLDCIFDFTAIWTPRSERDRDPVAIHRHSLLATRKVALRVTEGIASYADLVGRLFATYAKIHGQRGSGDKSAFFRHIDLDQIEVGVPHSRVIHVVRDGRDVALSWLSIWTGPVNLTQAALTWTEHVRAKRAWGKRHPDRYLEVRYEDLLAAPDQVLDSVGEFLGVMRKPGPLTFHASELATALAGGAPHAKVSEPLDPANSGKWRTGMGKADQAKFHFLAGDTLAECGYACGCAGLAGAQLIYMTLITAWERVRARLSRHELEIQLKAILPLALLLCHRMRIPLVRLLNRRYPQFVEPPA